LCGKPLKIRDRAWDDRGSMPRCSRIYVTSSARANFDADVAAACRQLIWLDLVRTGPR
jgi:hypothetical protein